MNKRLKKVYRSSSQISTTDLQTAKTILFSIFSRYGDGIISFTIIKEFILKYPYKKYIILVPRQQFPYAKILLGQYNNVLIKKINKRNPISFIKIVYFLQHTNIDLGLNPWGHGMDSEYFISFAKKFFFYKQFDKFAKTDNLYDRIRLYFHLDIIKEKQLISYDIQNKKNIVIAPISSDITKNLSIAQTQTLILFLKHKFPSASITLALPKKFKYFYKNIEKFIFGKSVHNSNQYLQLLHNCDLFIGVDSGPLHLALALDVHSIGIFGPTSPNTILDNNQKIIILRSEKMVNYFCFVKNCQNPICINETLYNQINSEKHLLDKNVILETQKCIMER
jgi:ADP-heptose:LPS heptosyltransferase